MLVYRIVHKKYAGALFAGGLAGRWNSEGKKVLYTAESVSLAYLETMHYRKGFGFNADFRIMIIRIPSNAAFLEVDTAELPGNWRDFRNYRECRKIGDEWFDHAEHLCLKVTSAVVPENSNIVVNTLHKGYQEVEMIDTLDFIPDERLENIIKSYK